MAAVCGALALGALLAGYVVGASVDGHSSLIVFWGLAAVLAGPLIGVAAHWVRRATNWRRQADALCSRR